ncbi:hypothetical protein G7083_13675 (plasmid) [Vibrio sp. HDW18]|uniref:hypothetical protein n=1 Tax=Vibrio sp. HDW18 TaxID=2714948 RepID=UPI00140751FA|nr:hypothetical protein [Vibrio sp. HDW18]QIL86926.1 hypothetical protein G7083_13675 [Vibrio sp. HDW18]
MFWRALIACWLVVFALALPAPLLACALEQKASESLDHGKPSTLPLSSTFSFTKAERVAHSAPPASSIPRSQSDVTPTPRAILNHALNGLAQRLAAGSSDLPFDSDPESSPWPMLAIAPHSVALDDSSRHLNRSYDFFSATHRIAGWKESNAMYVALNSQFLFSHTKFN